MIPGFLIEPTKSRLRRAAARVRDELDRLAESRIRALTGLVPIRESLPEDIFICGYPKSGNTWFQHLVTSIVYGVDVEMAPDALMNELLPDVHFKRFYRRLSDPCFFKSHHLPQPAYRRVVYLLRDGRDAMVSYYHHLNAITSDTDFAEMVTTGRGLFPGKWHEHVQAYAANPYRADLITIKYEDLKCDPLAELKRFCTFAHLDRDDATLVRAIERATFENMRKKESRFGWEGGAWPKDKPFVRQGKVGSFRQEMPEDILNAFLKDASAALAMHGYL